MAIMDIYGINQGIGPGGIDAELELILIYQYLQIFQA